MCLTKKNLIPSSCLRKAKPEKQQRRGTLPPAGEPRQAIKLRSSYTSRAVDPFEDLGFAPIVTANPKEKPTDKQIIMLANNGIEAESLTRKQAALVYQIMLRRKLNRPSFKQEAILKEHGLPYEKVTAKQAKDMIQELADGGWKKPEPPAG